MPAPYSDRLVLAGIELYHDDEDWALAAPERVPTIDALPNIFYRAVPQNGTFRKMVLQGEPRLRAAEHVWVAIDGSFEISVSSGRVFSLSLNVWIGQRPMLLAYRDAGAVITLIPGFSPWEMGVYTGMFRSLPLGDVSTSQPAVQELERRKAPYVTTLRRLSDAAADSLVSICRQAGG